jgi:hypothetical protein
LFAFAVYSQKRTSRELESQAVKLSPNHFLKQKKIILIALIQIIA